MNLRRIMRPRHVPSAEMGPVVVVSSTSVQADLRRAAEGAGMTYDEFIRRAEADDLEDDRLRDLWMMAEPALR